MAELTRMLENIGLEHIQTYIQSGNVVFQAEEVDKNELSTKMSQAIRQEKGFEPKILLLELNELETAIANNPFPNAKTEPKTLHLYFLTEDAKGPDLASLEKLKKDAEAFELKDKVFYLYAPEGIGRSKLAERVERALGVSVTARNWRTVTKVLELALAAKL